MQNPAKAKQVPVYILTGVLWLVSVVLGLAAIYYSRELTLLVYAVLGGDDFHAGVLYSQIAVVLTAMLWIGAIVGTGEYHIKHPGQRKSWIIFAWTIGIELLIILLAFLLRLT